MIKYFMRKKTLKMFDKESQDMLIKLNSQKFMIEYLCCMFWGVIYMLPIIPLCIIDLFEEVEFSNITQIAIVTFMVIYFIGILVLLKVFPNAMFVFSLVLAEKIYFLLYTTKGKAIGKNDFKLIKEENEKIYECIETQECRGYCYSICFEICKALKKGYIEFLAIKKISPQDDEKDDGRKFTMHVIYVNNGWAFDTYSSRQYLIEELYEIYKAKIYKKISFDELSGKSYEEVKKEQELELEIWASNNDCSMFFKEEENDT